MRAVRKGEENSGREGVAGAGGRMVMLGRECEETPKSAAEGADPRALTPAMRRCEQAAAAARCRKPPPAAVDAASGADSSRGHRRLAAIAGGRGMMAWTRDTGGGRKVGENMPGEGMGAGDITSRGKTVGPAIPRPAKALWRLTLSAAVRRLT